MTHYMSAATVPDVASENTVSSVEIRIVDNMQAWTELRQPWNDLVTASVYPNVFATWEWQTEWWKAFAADNRLRILVAEHEGHLVGLLPLFAKPQTWHQRDSMRLVGQGAAVVPDYLGLITTEEFLDPVASAIAEHLASDDISWSSLFLHEYATDDSGTTYLVKKLLHQYPGLQSAGEPRYVVNLPDTYDALLAGLSGHNRQKKRNRLRQASTRYGAELREIDHEELSEWFPIMEELTLKARQRTATRSSYEQPAYAAFQRSVLNQLMPSGQGRLFFLMQSEIPAACWYLYCYKQKVYAYQSASDPEQPGSPGDVALQLVIMQMIEEGYAEFDFLCGDHGYKRSYTSSQRTTCTMHAFRSRNLDYYKNLLKVRMLRPVKRRIHHNVMAPRGPRS